MGDKKNIVCTQAHRMTFPQVLSDELKRRQYDTYGSASGPGQSSTHEQKFWRGGASVDPEELFRKIFGDFTGAQGFGSFRSMFEQPPEVCVACPPMKQNRGQSESTSKIFKITVDIDFSSRNKIYELMCVLYFVFFVVCFIRNQICVTEKMNVAWLLECSCCLLTCCTS